VSAGGSLLYPLCVAVTEREELIVLNMAFPPEIIRVSPNGAQTVIARGGLLNRPQALAVRADHIYVTDVATADGNFGIGRVIDVDVRTGEETIRGGSAASCVGQLELQWTKRDNLSSATLIRLISTARTASTEGIIRINPATQEQTLIARGEGSFVNPRCCDCSQLACQQNRSNPTVRNSEEPKSRVQIGALSKPSSAAYRPFASV